MSASVRAQPSTASEHRPTAPDHKSTTSDHKSTTNDHRSTTSDHQPTAPDNRSTTTENRSTKTDHQSSNPEHRSTTSDHRPTAPDNRSTTTDHRSTKTDHRSTTSDHRPTAPDNRSTTSDHRPTTTDHRSIASDHRSTASTKSPRHAVKSPTCAHCGEAITDVVVQAMDSTWHQDHFLCAHCQRPISSQRYHVYDGKSYCEADYAALFLKKCSACAQPIKDVVVMALGRPWHREHFTCAGCSTGLSHKGFYERESQPYCLECFESKFCPTCHECDKPIIDQAVIALGDKYHVTCFRCGRCHEAIMDGSFKIIDAKPVCEKCFDK